MAADDGDRHGGGGDAGAVPLHEQLGWRWDLDEVERAITPRTRAIYVNSPNNPTGGMLTRAGPRAARRDRARARICG